MSDFMEMFVGMLPIHSQLQKEDNEFRKVLDRTLGAYMDNQEDILDELFLTTASGGWLDAHGRDYGVSRKLDESDADYRERIIFEKLEYLTAHNLMSIYGLTLYSFVDSFDASDNDLTSDNPFIDEEGYMTVASDEIKGILNKKFIVDGGITWL